MDFAEVLAAAGSYLSKTEKRASGGKIPVSGVLWTQRTEPSPHTME